MKYFVVIIIILSIGLVLPIANLNGQATIDTQQVANVVKVKKGSIFAGNQGKSLLLSLVIPGSGQWYNGSILRAHVAWAAVGGMGAVLVYNTNQYKCYRDGYIALIDERPLDLPQHCLHDNNGDGIHDIEQIDAARMRLLRDEANKYRQLSIVGFAVVWLLNGVDAFVDAHLKDFDIDEDLSIDIGPKMGNDPYAPMRMGVFVQF